LKAILLDTHMLLAGIFEYPRIKIDEDEATRLAETFARVARWYDIPEISEKAADHYAFFLAAVMVWGTRAMAEYRDRQNRQRGDVARVVNPSTPPGPSTRAQDGNGMEPPDPRHPRSVEVDGMGTVEIPPVSPNIQ
jgi:hypothetical protein